MGLISRVSSRTYRKPAKSSVIMAKKSKSSKKTYNIEKLVQHIPETATRAECVSYVVQWEGYPGEDTEEPMENMEADVGHLVDDYWNEQLVTQPEVTKNAENEKVAEISQDGTELDNTEMLLTTTQEDVTETVKETESKTHQEVVSEEETFSLGLSATGEKGKASKNSSLDHVESLASEKVDNSPISKVNPVENNEIYEIEAILDHKPKNSNKSKAKKYLIHWKDYPAAEASWQLADDVTEPALLDYWAA